MKNLVIITMLLLLCAASCKKENKNEDQLPPATQTGANTFGCLVNGKVYVPKGFNGTGTPNPKTQFDIGVNGQPYFNITVSRLSAGNVSEGNLFMSIGNLSTLGIYNYPADLNFLFGWNIIGDCGIIAFDTTVKKWGLCEITKYDLNARIISGKFNLKYKTLSCDTIFITNGRFDFKL